MTTVALAGSGNWIVPTGVSTLRVQAWAGNASGGGTGATIGWNGGGGGTGEYAEEATYAVTPGQSIPYSVGAAGAAATNAVGHDGGNSTFGTVTANGGKGGKTQAVGSSAAGGLGGTGSTNTIHHNGGTGGAGVSGTSGGGAAGGAGTGAAGNNGSGVTGGGSVTGGAAGPNGSVGGTGTAGTAPNGTTTGGSAGSGAYSNTNATRASGAGTAGQILITYTPPAGSNPYVMANPAPVNTNTATSVAITAGSAAGDAVVVCAATSLVASNAPSAVSDSKGNAYLLAQAVLSNLAVWIADGPTPLTTSDTATVNWSAISTNVKDIQVIGVPGAAQTSALDTVATASASGTSTTPSVTSGTITNPGSIALFVVNSSSAGGAPTTFGAFTSLGTVQTGGNQYLTVAYQVLAAPATVTASCTITSAQWVANLLIISPSSISAQAGTVVGADIEATSYPVGTLSGSMSQWTSQVINPGRTLDSVRVFFGATIPTTLAASGLSIHAGVRRVLMSLRPAANPTSSSDLAALDSLLSSCKTGGLAAKVALYPDPESAGLTVAQYQAMIAFYGPTVRKYYPLVYLKSALQTATNSAGPAQYYPGDANIDEVAYEFYEMDYRVFGQRLDPMAVIADAASPAKPFSVWETGVVVGGVGGTTPGPIPGQTTGSRAALLIGFDCAAGDWTTTNAAIGPGQTHRFFYGGSLPGAINFDGTPSSVELFVSYKDATTTQATLQTYLGNLGSRKITLIYHHEPEDDVAAATFVADFKTQSNRIRAAAAALGKGSQVRVCMAANAYRYHADPAAAAGGWLQGLGPYVDLFTVDIYQGSGGTGPSGTWDWSSNGLANFDHWLKWLNAVTDPSVVGTIKPLGITEYGVDDPVGNSVRNARIAADNAYLITAFQGSNPVSPFPLQCWMYWYESLSGDANQSKFTDSNTIATWQSIESVSSGGPAGSAQATQAQGTAYMNYVTNFFKARLTAGKPVGDVSYYNYVNQGNNWDFVIQSGAYLAALYDTMYDALSSSTGSGPVPVNIAAESDILLGSTVTLNITGPAPPVVSGDSAVVLYGSGGTFGSQTVALQTSTLHSFKATPVSNWGFGAGLCIFYTKAMLDGQIILGSLPVTGNELKPTMDHAELNVFDPNRQAFYRNIIPTSTGKLTAVNPASGLGGTDAGGGDINAVSIAATAPVFMGDGGDVHTLNGIDPTVAAWAFNKNTSYLIGHSVTTSPVQDSYAALPVLKYESYAQFAADVAASAITFAYAWVLYDPESWTLTPANEQNDPWTYMQSFTTLAHAHGYSVILTPGRDLGNIATSVRPKNPGESLDDWYIRIGMATSAAQTGAEVLEVQDQANTTNIAEYKRLFNTAFTQARAVNPAMKVWAGLSTTYGTPTQQFNAMQSIAADGYWYNIIGDTTDTDAFLTIAKTSSTSARAVATLEGYYFQWDIGVYGLYPVLCYLMLDGNGNWVYDPVTSKTSNQWEATAPAIYDAVIGNGTGQGAGVNGNIWTTRAAGQITILPASGRLVILHYFGVGTHLSGVVSVSDASGNLLAAVQLPNVTPTDGTTITSLDPRDCQADPSSVLNDERFVIIYDAFGTSVQQCCQEFTYNETAKTIAAKSVPFCLTDTFGTRHADPVFSLFGPDGTLYLSGGAGLTSMPMAVYVKSGSERSYVTNFPQTAVTTATGGFLTGNASTFEGGLANWVQTGNNAVAGTTLQAHGGTHSMMMTSAASGNMQAASVVAGSITTLGMSVMPGDTVVASAWFRAAVSARSCNIGVEFYTNAGVIIGAALRGGNVTDSTSAFTQATCTVTAPATAAYCRASVQVLATGAASEVHYIDDVLMTSWAYSSWPTPAQPDFALGFPASQNLGALAGPMAQDTQTGAVMIAGNYFSGTIPDATHTALNPNLYSAQVASCEPTNTLSADDAIFDTSVGHWTMFLGGISRSTTPPVAPPAGVNAGLCTAFAGISTGSLGITAYPAAPGQTWEASVSFLAVTTPRVCDVFIRWIDGGGASLGDTTHGSASDNTTTWTTVKATGTAPANTAHMQLWFSIAAAAENHYIASNFQWNLDPALLGFGSFLTTIQCSDTQALDGKFSLAVTAPFTNETLAANSPDVGVIPSMDYLAKASFRAGATGRAATIIIRWKDSTGAFIGSDMAPTRAITSTTTGWTEAWASAQAPSNAATAQIVLQPVTVSIGETVYVDRFSIQRQPFTPVNKVDYGLIGVRNDRPGDIVGSNRPSVVGQFIYLPVTVMMGAAEQTAYTGGGYTPATKPQYLARLDLLQVLANQGLFTPPLPVIPALPQIQSPWKFLYGPPQPTGGVTGEITQAATRSLTMRAGAASFSEVALDLNGRDFIAGELPELKTDIQVRWGPDLLFVGRVGSTSDSLDADGHRTTITASDYREVLRRRILTSVTNLNFTGSEVAFIAWTLIDTIQKYHGGDLGIQRGRGQVTGIKQTWAPSVADYAGEDIDSLAQMDPAFDWDITPYGPSDLRLDVWPGVRGTAKGVILESGGELVSTMSRTVDPATYGNAVYLTGGGSSNLTPQILEASDLSTRTEGRFDRLVATNYILAASLQAAASGYLKDAEQLLPTYTIVLKPGVWMGPDHLWIGDTVHVRIKSGRLLVDDDVFVTEMDFVVSPDGVETLTITAGRIPFRLRLKLPRVLRSVRGKNPNTLLG